VFRSVRKFLLRIKTLIQPRYFFIEVRLFGGIFRISLGEFWIDNEEKKINCEIKIMSLYVPIGRRIDQNEFLPEIFNLFVAIIQ